MTDVPAAYLHVLEQVRQGACQSVHGRLRGGLNIRMEQEQ